MSELRIGAVLLAAGAGSRLGGRPKALLELDGVPLITGQLAALEGAGAQQIVVVLGHYAQVIEAALVASKVTRVHNPDPDAGQDSSVLLGLQALKLPLDAVIVALVDQPLIDARDIRALMQAFKNRGDEDMVVPRVNTADGGAAPGNPVVLNANLCTQWLASAGALMSRKWREANPTKVLWMETTNHHYRTDIDTQEDLESFIVGTKRSLA